MKLLKKLITKPKAFQRNLGLSRDQFQVFLERVQPLWDQAEKNRKTRDSRQRSIGGGRPYKCASLEEMMFMVLLYYKTYMTQELIGCFMDLDQSNVSRLFKKILHLIEKAADPELVSYLSQAKAEFDKIPPHERINDWATFLRKYPDLKEASSDATEQQCYRSSDYATQKKYYSGKSIVHPKN